MPETTGWCHWHQGISGTARMVQIIEQSSGPGRQLYACAPCRDQHHLTAIGYDADTLAYRAYINHLQDCRVCTDSGRCPVGQPMWDTYQAALHTTAVC